MVSAMSVKGNFVDWIELPESVHPFFIGTQGHPEYSSRPLAPHPVFLEFLKPVIITKRFNNYMSLQTTVCNTSVSIGDTVTVGQKIQEGEKERIQNFTGIVIAIKEIKAKKLYCPPDCSRGDRCRKDFPDRHAKFSFAESRKAIFNQKK